MGILISWILSALVILCTAYLFQDGVHVENFTTALVVALVLGIINAILKPVLFFLTLPITIITLGLFTLVINALLILLTDYLIDGFSVANFWWALLYGIILSFTNTLINKAHNHN